MPSPTHVQPFEFFGGPRFLWLHGISGLLIFSAFGFGCFFEAEGGLARLFPILEFPAPLPWGLSRGLTLLFLEDDLDDSGLVLIIFELLDLCLLLELDEDGLSNEARLLFEVGDGLFAEDIMLVTAEAADLAIDTVMGDGTIIFEVVAGVASRILLKAIKKNYRPLNEKSSSIRLNSMERTADCEWAIQFDYVLVLRMKRTGCPSSKVSKAKGYILETKHFWPLVDKAKMHLRTIQSF